MPTVDSKALEFYSVGTETLLGHRGWACSQLSAADGSSEMAVYPPGTVDPIDAASPPVAGQQLIEASYDYTEHLPGVDLVCPYFPAVVSTGETCPSAVPEGEKVTHKTADIVSIVDPVGVRGGLPSSGGKSAVEGYLIVPQTPDLSLGVNVAEVSCSLHAANLCPTVLADFAVREFPIPAAPTS